MDVPNSVIESCRRGDPDGFTELIRLTHRDVFSLAMRITGNPEDAADVSQETYIRLLRTIGQFRGEAKFSTWLYRVASSVAISHMRKRSRRARFDLSMEPEDWNSIPAPSSADPAVASQQASLRQRLDEALGRLPAAYRTVVVMKDVYGLSLQEAANQLGITEGAAKVRLFRARRRLRDWLYEERSSQAPGEPGNEAAKKHQIAPRALNE